MPGKLLMLWVLPVEVKQEADSQLAGTSTTQKKLLQFQRLREAGFSIKRRTNQSPRWSLGAKFHQGCHLGCPQTLQCFHGTYQTVRNRCFHQEASQTLNVQNSVQTIRLELSEGHKNTTYLISHSNIYNWGSSLPWSSMRIMSSTPAYCHASTLTLPRLLPHLNLTTATHEPFCCHTSILLLPRWNLATATLQPCYCHAGTLLLPRFKKARLSCALFFILCFFVYFCFLSFVCLFFLRFPSFVHCLFFVLFIFIYHNVLLFCTSLSFQYCSFLKFFSYFFLCIIFSFIYVC